jgi:Putative beta-barrel porin-2, OmpL-like. bbp2
MNSKNITIKKILGAVILLICRSAMAQDSTNEKSSPLSFSGFAEAYYSYDFNKPVDNNRPWFLYSHNRHNEFNINLAFVKGSYNTDKIRANIAIAVGTFMNANYAAEPGVLKNIYEGNVGVKISKNKNLWLDAGIFSSHIGFESAQSPSCLVLTRSVIAENSPYYECGAKISYTSENDKWLFSALALNGWQRIQRVSGNSLMSWGTQITFTASDKVTLNYSTFLGTDKPDSARLWRIFHDIYGIFHLTNKLELILGVDLGQEQLSKGSSDYNTWCGAAGILQYAFNHNWALAFRGEYYSDEDGVMISTGTPNGFKTSGFSFNIDGSIGEHLLWRTEFRLFNSKDAIFIKDNNSIKNNHAITTSLALTF